MIPTAVCPKCGRKYAGWALKYNECKCCGVKLEWKEE